MSHHLEYNGVHDHCPHPIEQDGVCIFHVRKLSHEEQKTVSADKLSAIEELEAKFRRAFFKLLHEMEADTTTVVCDFRAFSFPSMDFGEFEFSKAVRFSYCTFSQNVELTGATFRQAVHFYRTTFREFCDFYTVTFNGKTEFFATDFSQGVRFAYNTFNQTANFNHTVFKDAEFSESVFHGNADFSRAIFENALFNRTHFLGECFFQGLRIDKKNSVVTFEKVNLAKASFLDTNLEQIGFRDVDWSQTASKTKIWQRTTQLWDESRPLQEDEFDRDYEKIAENYRQLVINYERKRDFDTAENFHIGEMEMRRKKKGLRVHPNWWRAMREWVNAYGVYRVLSNYGTNYSQGLTMLLILVLLFSGLFLYSGFRPPKDSTDIPGRIIEYDLWPDSEHRPVSLSQWLSDYAEAILFTVSILSFQRERFYEAVGGFSRLWCSISTIVLTGQTALVLLAIRRRFRR